MADPQPQLSVVEALSNQGYRPEETDHIMQTLTEAGFRLVPPGWDVVKLEDTAWCGDPPTVRVYSIRERFRG